MSAPGENINPRILVWARETAGLSLAEAAHRLKLSADTDASAAKLTEMEAGTRLPTRSQLAKFTALYRRPLVAFYMDAPPPRGERGEDFRAGHGMVSERQNALLDALLRDIRARQAMVRSVLEDEDEAAPLPYVGSASMREGVSSMAAKVTKALGLSTFAKGRPGGADELFRQLRARAEQMGVFVLLVGDLGSYHSAIGEDVFRGFAIADPIAPFIVINDQDAKTARGFTLVHELTHIYLGQSGVSGTPDEASESTPVGRIEQFCNDVAGEVLMPDSGLAPVPAGVDRDGKDAAARVIQSIALTWSVSEPMVAYRLHRLGRISGATNRALQADYAARWREIKAKERAKDQQKEGGPSFYVLKQHKLGDGLMEVVRRTLRDNLLSHTKAAKVLGVKSSSVEPLLRRFEPTRITTGSTGCRSSGVGFWMSQRPVK